MSLRRDGPIFVDGRPVEPTDAVAEVLRHLKADAAIRAAAHLRMISRELSSQSPSTSEGLSAEPFGKRLGKPALASCSLFTSR